MSVCEHDPYCPGYGPDHIAGTKRRLTIFDPAPPKHQPSKTPNKDRTLSGKNRRRSRKEK